MSMTVAALHKRLGALIEAGHGRKPVLVDRDTFSDPRDNDGNVLLPPWAVQGPRWIATADDDGGTKWNRDGTESGQQCVVIVGDCAEPEATAGAPVDRSFDAGAQCKAPFGVCPDTDVCNSKGPCSAADVRVPCSTHRAIGPLPTCPACREQAQPSDGAAPADPVLSDDLCDAYGVPRGSVRSEVDAETPQHAHPQAALTDAQIEPLFRQVQANISGGGHDEWFWFAAGVESGEKAHGIAAPLGATDAEDAQRFRWLTEDHADSTAREKCREIIGRLPVMSYSAAIDAIDVARGVLVTPKNETKGGA